MVHCSDHGVFARINGKHTGRSKRLEVTHMLKAIHAQKSRDTAERKANAIIADLLVTICASLSE
jgi:hypothetical protein